MSDEEIIDKSVEKSQESRVETNHVSDSLTLLLYLGLLIVTLLTVWLFKHHRLRYIHETGLAVIYGLLVGAIIRYGSQPSEFSVRRFNATGSLPGSDALPPEKVLVTMLEIGDNNQSRVYEYDYKRRLYGNEVRSPILDEKATFNPEVFFNIILPPIIFCAGYSMKRKHFFRNIGAILTLAFIGTTISCVVVGSLVYGITRLSTGIGSSILFNECLLFGALISATDPVTVLAIFNDLNVDVDLYALVFGESVLNDAVAIVLSQSIEKYGALAASAGGIQGEAILKAVLSFLGVFFGALGISSAMGCLTALITKYTRVRDHPLLESSLFILMSYSTFLAAEAARSTGIVAVLFCGICQAHYTYNNLSRESKESTKNFFELLNFLAENFTFLYIGVSTFTYSSHLWDPVFIFAAFVAILLGRALNVYPLCLLLNLGRRNRIGANKMHMLMFSGLRGAIAFALAIRNTSSSVRKMMLSTTLLIVIATVLLCGSLTTQMLQWLRIRVGVEEEAPKRNYEDIQSGSEAEIAMASAANRGSNRAWFARSWHGLDNRLLKPLLTHARPLLTETCPRCCLPLAQLLTTDEQLTQASVQRDLIADNLDDAPPEDEASTSSTGPAAGGNFNDFGGLANPAGPGQQNVVVRADLGGSNV
ncbi:hypothetical protein BOX15_Mlig030381g2 [Macrostomum lignano]|uniref:Sodium/hydrogen exchanger n=1 Tax=Macrostomum lignano TaxID=282301 RepID=A0A267GH55_9PLAT|nr:hypothetical protein BOX15_Mlig030381g2 [Macrostomum lignano]